MNGNDERGLDPMDTDRLIGGRQAQGNTVASVPNTSHSTFKIDSLSIKLGIVKEKGDAQKCRHFSIRGYVAGMRETGRSNLLPFTEELPPMDVPNFRYWLCQMCLQNSGTASSLHETPSVPGCNQCVLQPFARPSLPQNRAGLAVLPFGEGTSGLKPVDSKNDDGSILSALGANQSQSSQEIPPNVAVSQEVTKVCSVDTNDAAEANAGSPDMRETIDSRAREDPQQTNMVKETVTSPENQPIQQDQQNDYPNGHPRRRTRKVRLLKELMCGNSENQQQTKENATPSLGPRACSTAAPSSQLKRKTLHDQVQDQRPDDVTTPGHASKKAKVLKGNEIAKNNVVEHSKDPGIGECGETTNKFQWNKVGTQRSSILGRVGNDAETAWRSIFSDMGRTDNNQVAAGSGGSRPTFGISQDKGAEPYSNFMAPPKPDKKINSSKKISSNPPKSKFFGEGSRRMDVGGSRPNDRPSDTELGLGLSLNFDPQAQARSQPPILNRTSNQDHSRNAGFFFGEPTIAPRIPSDPRSNEGLVHDVSNRYAPGTAFLQDQRPYTQYPYGSCSGHQKLDFSDPYKTNTGFRGYSDILRPHNHQRQEKFTIGRSDEREVVELLAKNQYERSLCEARSRFSPNGNSNSGMPNTSGFRNVGMNEGMASSPHGYFNMMRPTSENVGPNTIRNPPAGFYHQDRVSSFTMFDGLTQSQKHPSNGVWMSDSLPPRHQNSPYHHHAPRSDNKMAHGHTYLYPPTNSQVPESFNMYRNGPQQNDVFSNAPISIPFSDPYANYSDKDKGKNMMNLDLNLVAPNAVEEQNNLESTDLNPKHMRGSLESSYSNEAIPAMQLLSLMDAGKPSRPFNTDARKASTKPLSPPYSHCNSTMTGKPNLIANSHLPYSGLRPGALPYPTERHILSPPGNSSSLAVGSALHNVFRTEQNVRLPSSQKSRGASFGSASHSCRQEDSYLFPLPWHATEDRNKLVTMETNRSFVPRYESSGTEVCTINRNPADFTTPGAENIYMINPDDLVAKGKSSSKVKASVSVNELKRQKKVLKPAS
uniref:Embryonic flower 1 n=1 Tax=Chrysanthemum morifolium TaxID=41568 RepID=R4TUH6_CHRMO|nr:embryonic flower 1 [Chrysanthemum x morifolium]